jgi:hypothetical protein
MAAIAVIVDSGGSGIEPRVPIANGRVITSGGV